MKVVLDANLFINAVLEFRGKPARILDLWRANRFDLLMRAGMIEEIREVLGRPRIRERHQWTDGEIERFVSDLGELSIVTPGKLAVEVIADNPDDNMYLACAVEGEADYIVSGDQHLLRLGAYKSIRIVTPAQFLEILEGES